jgi:two-component system NtrC family sensor kinase
VPSPDLDPETLIALNRMVIVSRSVLGTAHDVNNALQIIGGSADILAQRPDVLDVVQRTVQRIGTQTTRAADALRMLMELARGSDAVDSRLSLRAVASEAVTLRAHPMRRERISVAFDAAQAPEALVRGQRSQLLQVTLNLLMNAEEALTGRVGESIQLSLSEVPARVELSVTDRGSGIPADILEHLFTPFASSRPARGGPGIGLAAARLIARRHGGDVTIETGGSGTRATVFLPAAS